MKIIIRNLKFRGYKKFSEWVTIDFETNINKYQNKEYVRKFKYDGMSELNYNSIIGIIGTNTSGKTSTLEIFNKYTSFVQTSNSPFTKFTSSNPFDPENHRDHRPEKPESYADVRGTFRGKLARIFGDSNFFNAANESIDITVELVTEGLYVTHELSFFRDNQFTENVYIKKRVNRNETTQQIFKKAKEREISFKTFANLIESDEIVLSSRLPNISNEDIRKANEVIQTIGATIALVGESDIPFVTLSANPYFDNPEDEADLQKRMHVLEKIIKIIDKSVVSVRKNHQFGKRFTEFEFVLDGDVVVKESALSTGTVKFANIVLGGLASRRILGDVNKYILVDEIDNSWHPNLTKSFIGLLKDDETFNDFSLICTFHNPYVSSEFREDALYVITKEKKVETWVQFKNDYNKQNPTNKLRLEHSFQKKYLEDIINGAQEDLSMEFLKDKTKADNNDC